MKNLVTILCAAAGLFLARGAEPADALWAENLRLTQEAAELRARVNALSDECARRTRTAHVLDVTCDLMTGARAVPPRRVERLVPVAAFETDAPCVLEVKPGAKPQVVHRWPKGLKDGARYRFSCRMKAEGVTGCEHVKFGGFVGLANGKKAWPSASTGAGTFDWRTVTFDYTLPSGAGFCLLYGIEAGHGKVEIRDVRIEEVTETEE